MIEASTSQLQDDEKEWYYNRGGADSKDREGPIGFNKVWQP